METYAELMKGTRFGPMIIAGDVEGSNLVAIIKKWLSLKIELYTILQILGLTLFEKTPLDQLLMTPEYQSEVSEMTNQLNLFDLTLGH